MSLFSSLARGAAQFRADVGGAPAPWDDWWYGPVAASSASGLRVNADSAKRIGAALACVNIISRNIAMMPVKIMTDQANGGKKPVPKHPVYGLLATRPNALQTSFEFRQMMQAHVELRGNAYAKIVPGPRGAVDQLVPMHPDRVIVEQLRDSGRLRYKYNDPLTGNTEPLMQEEVFHLRNYSEDGINGLSTISMAVDVYSTALAEQDYAARFFQNDAKTGLVFEGANFKTKQDEERFLASWQAAQTGKNRHKTALLPLGITAKELGVKPSDAQLLEARKFSRIEICSLFGVPSHLIGETEKAATYASVEQFNIMFVTQCLLPRVVMWEQAISRDLILSDKYYPKFSMAALLRGDTAARYAAYQIGVQNGWLSPNDIRLLEDLNPIEGGDQYWRPLNWAPLTQTTNPEPASTDAEPDEVTETDSSANAHQDLLPQLVA